MWLHHSVVVDKQWKLNSEAHRWGHDPTEQDPNHKPIRPYKAEPYFNHKAAVILYNIILILFLAALFPRVQVINITAWFPINKLQLNILVQRTKEKEGNSQPALLNPQLK